MPGPKDKLNEDLKAAMKGGDATRKDAIRYILSAIKQVEIDTRETLTDERIYGILQNEAKKRRDSIAESRKAGREDLATKDEYELKLIESYLPQQLTRAEIEKEARVVITEVGASSPKDTGAVMKILLPRVKGRADGKLVNEVVSALLKQG
ncbi:MAG: GatB/YqeY domain-containing protein [Aggregatilineales bacterium]